MSQNVAIISLASCLVIFNQVVAYLGPLTTMQELMHIRNNLCTCIAKLPYSYVYCMGQHILKDENYQA